MRPTDLQSKVIAFLRFPLVVLALFMHCNFSILGGEWGSLPFASGFIHVMSQRIAPMVCPLFFFISGYLFFKTGFFTADVYVKKLTRRFLSLFVPFLLWNLLYLVLVIIIGLFSSQVPILGIPIEQMSFINGLKAMWNMALIPGGNSLAAPVCVPFWFVRDLMVTVILSPLIYWAVTFFIRISGKKPLVRYILFTAIVFGIGFIPSLSGLNPESWLFFAFGAYFAIKKKEFIVAMLPYAVPMLITLVILIILEQWMPCEFIYHLEQVVTVIFVISFTTMMVRSGTWYVNDMTLSHASFFLFASQYMFLGPIVMLLGSGFLMPHNSILAIVIYIVPVILTTVLGLILYWLMRTRLPFITYLLMGGRR